MTASDPIPVATVTDDLEACDNCGERGHTCPPLDHITVQVIRNDLERVPPDELAELVRFAADRRQSPVHSALGAAQAVLWLSANFRRPVSDREIAKVAVLGLNEPDFRPLAAWAAAP